MPHTEKFTYPAIQDVLTNDDLSTNEKIRILKKQLEEERAMQRAATESNMVGDAEQGARMRELEIALDSLDANVVSSEDTQAATL